MIGWFAHSNGVPHRNNGEPCTISGWLLRWLVWLPWIAFKREVNEILVVKLALKFVELLLV